jgi:hypothetical protein
MDVTARRLNSSTYRIEDVTFKNVTELLESGRGDYRNIKFAYASLLELVVDAEGVSVRLKQFLTNFLNGELVIWSGSEDRLVEVESNLTFTSIFPEPETFTNYIKPFFTFENLAFTSPFSVPPYVRRSTFRNCVFRDNSYQPKLFREDVIFDGCTIPQEVEARAEPRSPGYFAPGQNICNMLEFKGDSFVSFSRFSELWPSLYSLHLGWSRNSNAIDPNVVLDTELSTLSIGDNVIFLEGIPVRRGRPTTERRRHLTRLTFHTSGDLPPVQMEIRKLVFEQLVSLELKDIDLSLTNRGITPVFFTKHLTTDIIAGLRQIKIIIKDPHVNITALLEHLFVHATNNVELVLQTNPIQEITIRDFGRTAAHSISVTNKTDDCIMVSLSPTLTNLESWTSPHNARTVNLSSLCIYNDEKPVWFHAFNEDVRMNATGGGVVYLPCTKPRPRKRLNQEMKSLMDDSSEHHTLLTLTMKPVFRAEATSEGSSLPSLTNDSFHELKSKQQMHEGVEYTANDPRVPAQLREVVNWILTLSVSEKLSLFFYTTGFVYRINQVLLQKPNVSPLNELEAKFSRILFNLCKSIPPLREDITVFRGFTNDLDSRMFTSTSLDPDVAVGFISTDKAQSRSKRQEQTNPLSLQYVCCLHVIRIPRGARVFYFPNGMNKITEHDESEVLIPPNMGSYVEVNPDPSTNPLIIRGNIRVKYWVYRLNDAESTESTTPIEPRRKSGRIALREITTDSASAPTIFSIANTLSLNAATDNTEEASESSSYGRPRMSFGKFVKIYTVKHPNADPYKVALKFLKAMRLVHE